MDCPSCQRPLSRTARGQPRMSKRAAMMYVVSGVVTLVWAGVLYLWSPVFLVPRGVAGIALCAILYLGPGLLVGAYASQMPKLRTMRCGRCKWTETALHG